jgi:hypothetical protein
MNVSSVDAQDLLVQHYLAAVAYAAADLPAVYRDELLADLSEHIAVARSQHEPTEAGVREILDRLGHPVAIVDAARGFTIGATDGPAWPPAAARAVAPADAAPASALWYRNPVALAIVVIAALCVLALIVGAFATAVTLLRVPETRPGSRPGSYDRWARLTTLWRVGSWSAPSPGAAWMSKLCGPGWPRGSRQSSRCGPWSRVRPHASAWTRRRRPAAQRNHHQRSPSHAATVNATWTSSWPAASSQLMVGRAGSTIEGSAANLADSEVVRHAAAGQRLMSCSWSSSADIGKLLPRQTARPSLCAGSTPRSLRVSHGAATRAI